MTGAGIHSETNKTRERMTRDPSQRRWFSSSSDDNDDDIQKESYADGSRNKENDCPLCAKYLSGPCGRFFKEWYDCTNQNPSDYAQKCQPQFEAFSTCLEQHDESPENGKPES
jgi:hypothetical protein